MFSKSSLIPPRYLFADPSSQSMKAAAISELYLLNENTNGSSSFLARRQGRQQGVGVGVGAGGDGAGSSFAPEAGQSPGSWASKVLKGKPSARWWAQCPQGKTCPETTFSTPATWSQTDFMSLLKASFLAGRQGWEMVSAKDEGTGLRQRMARRVKADLFQLFSKVQNLFGNPCQLTPKHKTSAPDTAFHSEISLPWIDIISPKFFTSWGIPFWIKKIRFPFYLTTLCDYIPLELISPCLLACSSLYGPSSFVLGGMWFPELSLLRLSTTFGYSAGLKAPWQWTVKKWAQDSQIIPTPLVSWLRTSLPTALE